MGIGAAGRFFLFSSMFLFCSLGANEVCRVWSIATGPEAGSTRELEGVRALCAHTPRCLWCRCTLLVKAFLHASRKCYKTSATLFYEGVRRYSRRIANNNLSPPTRSVPQPKRTDIPARQTPKYWEDRMYTAVSNIS